MIEPRRPHDELNDLLWAIEDGSISAEGVARLDELVCKDPTLLRQYVEYARLLADLRFGLPARSARDALHQVFRGLGTSVPSETSEAADEFGASVPTPEPSVPTLLADSADPFATPHSSLRGWLLSYVAATVVVGAAIVAAWFYRMSPSPKADFNQPQIVHRDAPKPAKVGRISDMANCRLGRSANAAHDRNGPVARGQTFALDSGFLEIAYDSGATVLLQGPCAYEVDSDRGGFLSRGKLVARVAKSEVRRPQSPIPSPLFTIRTPTATVTDLGTEFGVEVDAAGATRSSVFEGRVDVAPHESNAQKATAKRPIRLVAGQSVRVARDAEGHGLRATRGQADAASFPVRPGHLAEFAEQERLKPFRRWLAYSQRLRKDPALVAYYTFETRGRDPKRDMSILPNVAATGEALDGHIDGPRWTEGRLPGKFALRFWGAGYRDRVEIPEAERLHFAGSFSFAVWFESEVDAGYCGHLLAKGNEDWRLCMAPGNIEFTTGDVSRGTAASNVLVTSASFKPSDWHLAVATFQCDQRVARKRVYVDGQLLASSTGPLLVSPPHGAAATIGDNAVWASGGQFAGLIDEVAIFSRALTAGEIKEMFAAGSPSPANARGSLQPVTPSTQRETKR